MKHNDIFENLFVLELANNHLGDVKRGLEMIEEFSQVVRFNGIKAAIKLQFRDIETFVHPNYKNSQDLNYIKKTTDKRLTRKEYKILVDAIIQSGCIPMSTPFDEASVDLCQEFDLPIIKIASSDINDWPLIEKIAKLKKHVIISTGGASLKDVDDIVKFFENRNIPLAINHCVSHYPTEDHEQELNQIDFLINRYSGHVIGHSTHEYHDWHDSMLIAYAKGARTFERHIDTPIEGYPFKKYNSTSEQIDRYFKAFKRAQVLCGNSGTNKRMPTQKEVKYLDDMVRGVYAKKTIPVGFKISKENFDEFFYLAVPLHQGQLSVREIKNGEVFSMEVKKDEKVMIDHIVSPYSNNKSLRSLIYSRGIKTSINKKND